MAHLTNIPYIGSGNILTFLDLFAQDLQRRYNLNNIVVNVLVVGGSALALKYNARSTVDIDADIQYPGSIKASINYVAQAYNIPADWLNQDFMLSTSYSRRLWNDVVLCRVLQGYLYVYVVSDVNQLCMKLASGRSKDLADVNLLAEKCFYAGWSEEQILSRFDLLYPGTEYPKPRALGTMRRVFKRLIRLNKR